MKLLVIVTALMVMMGMVSVNHDGYVIHTSSAIPASTPCPGLQISAEPPTARVDGTITDWSGGFITISNPSPATAPTRFCAGFETYDTTPAIGQQVQIYYNPSITAAWYLVFQRYPFIGGPSPTPTPSVTPTPIPTPTPTPVATPTPTPTPIATPTPLPPATCSITVPASLSMGQWSYAIVTVSLADLTGPVSVSAYSNTGQVTVYPSSRSVTGTSASLQFQVSSKKKSGTVTFNSPCGSRSLQVIVK